MNELLFSSFWPAFLTAAVLAWPIYRLLLLTKSRQKIDPFAPETHQAKQGTPTMGGLIIVVGAMATLLARSGDVVSSATQRPLLASWVLLLGFAMIGFVDDFVVPRIWKGKRGLGWKQKIALEVLFAAIAGYALFGATPAAGFAVFLILFFSNAYNFSDGLDGLAGTIWLGLALGLVLLPNALHPLNIIVAMGISGGVVAFLFLNAPPAKVFMGDVGSLPIGALLGMVIAGQVIGRDGTILPANFAAPIFLSLLMVAELVPVPMQVGYFKLTKGKRLFPYTPIHHAFEKKGWKETRVVYTFALVQLLLSLFACTLAGTVSP